MLPCRGQLQYCHLRRPRISINSIKDVLMRSAIRLTGSVFAYSDVGKLPFLSSLTSCGISAITSAETVGIDEVSNDFDSLVRNNKIRTMNRPKHARFKTGIEIDELKKFDLREATGTSTEVSL